jgi:hypothetical protein
MPNFTSDIVTTPSALTTVYAATATPPIAVGTKAITRDGRRFRFVKAGAVDLVVGNILQAAAQIADHQLAAVTATAVGARVVNVTPAGTGGAANLYAGGYAIIGVTPNLGDSYLIDSHPAITASTAFNLTLAADDAVRVAFTTATKLTLVANPYSGVIQSPVTTLTGAVVGVAVSIIPANGWGWIQTGGPAALLVAGTPGVGLAVVVPGTAAGAAVIDGAATATQVIGSMMITGADGKCGVVLLNLP